MKKLSFPIALLSLAVIGHLAAEQLPEIRPALLKPGPDSLVNLIDTARLMKEGQGDAVVRFTIFVDTRRASVMYTYRSSPGSTKLAEEAARECPRSRFIKAVYDHKECDADMTGTIIFVVMNGKPHLRIFLNQDEEHLKKGDDFVAPQELYPWNVSHESSEYFRGVNGSCRLQLQVDATGKLLRPTLLSESPPGNHMGDAYMYEMQYYRGTPGYLNGKPVACTTTKQFVAHVSDSSRWSDSN